MGKDKGWVKIYRGIEDHYLWADEPANKMSAWIDLILMANHKESKMVINSKVTTIPPGTVCVSIRFLAERWKWSKTKVSRFIDLLEQDKMIQKCGTVSGTPSGTLINLVNYRDYQGFQTLAGTLTGTPIGTVIGTVTGTPSGTVSGTKTIMYKNVTRM